MSYLIDELEYIMDWLESANSEFEYCEFVDCYNRGLTRQQINKLTKDLPFKLPEEVYELYQWRNGKADLDFNNYCPSVEFLFPKQINDSYVPFWPLKESIQNYHDLWKIEQQLTSNSPSDRYEGWGEKWFPIASFENKTMLYIIGDLDPSPVYLIDYIFMDNPLRIYKSLTDMVSVIAECCELGLYQIVPDESYQNLPDMYGEEDVMAIQLDESKLDIEKSIYRKYRFFRV